MDYCHLMMFFSEWDSSLPLGALSVQILIPNLMHSLSVLLLGISGPILDPFLGFMSLLLISGLFYSPFGITVIRI